MGNDIKTGRYEDEKNTTVSFIPSLVNENINDAILRFRNKLLESEIDTIILYIDLLQPMAQWKEISIDQLHVLKSNDMYGFYLTLPNGNSATFLPEVWSKESEWTIEDLLGHLSQKAGGNNDDWKMSGSRILLYKTYRTDEI